MSQVIRPISVTIRSVEDDANIYWRGTFDRLLAGICDNMNKRRLNEVNDCSFYTMQTFVGAMYSPAYVNQIPQQKEKRYSPANSDL